MNSNELVLLEGVLASWKVTAPADLADDALFELFSIEQVPKDYDLSTDEMQDGRIGAGKDGGIDGLFTFLDNDLLDTDTDISDARRNPELNLKMLQAKRTPAFAAGTFDALLATFDDIFDLGKDLTLLRELYSEDLLEKIEIFRHALVSLAAKHPRLTIEVIYSSKGSTAGIHPMVLQKARQVEDKIRHFFAGSEARVSFVDARQLLDLAAKEPNYTLELKFADSPISGADSYIVLVNLRDYFSFITDETGLLRRYIFEWNVRDDQGNVEVNLDIQPNS